MLTTFSFLDPTTIDSMVRFALHNPKVSSVIGGIGLGNLFYHLPRFRKEKAQTIGIGVLATGYLLDPDVQPDPVSVGGGQCHVALSIFGMSPR